MLTQEQTTILHKVVRSAVMTRLLLYGMGGIAVLSALVMIPPLVVGQWMPEGPQVAYMSATTLTGWYNWDIYLLDVDRRLSQQVTNGLQYERYPSWSPDGQYLIYHSNQRGSYDLYSMDMSEGLPELPRIVLNPAMAPGFNEPPPPLVNQNRPVDPFSPDLNAAEQIFPLSLELRNTNEAMPQWSPDGRYIAYHANDDFGIYNIFLTDPVGEEVIQVTFSEQGNAIRLMWSPDGKRAVYTIENTIGGLNMYVATVEELLSGSPQNPYPGTPITNDEFNENLFPAWSPDGEWIAFVSNRTGDQDVYLIPAEGGEVINLTYTLGVEETQPAWTPDGRILFASNRHGSYDLYMMDADGSNLTRLTFDTETSEEAPAWQPN